MAAPLPLDFQLCFALYSASMEVGRVYKPILDRLGLTYPQYLVLLVLWEQDAPTIGGIAERLSLESSTVTPLVKRLEAAGLVARHRNPDDERQVHVHLTEKGRDLRADCACVGEALVERAGMPLDDLATLHRAVTTFRAALKGRG